MISFPICYSFSISAFPLLFWMRLVKLQWINKPGKSLYRGKVHYHLCSWVVSSGTNHPFKVKQFPKEYILTMPKRLHFFGSWFRLLNYTSSIFLLYFLQKKLWVCKILNQKSGVFLPSTTNIDDVCSEYNPLELNWL